MGKKKEFKPLKIQGELEKSYEVPEQLKYSTGIQIITENGILHRESYYEKIYSLEENDVKASNVEKIKGCTMMLRGTDVDFCFYEDNVNSKVLLLIRLEGKTSAEAKEAFRVLEEDLLSNLHTFGITVHPMNAEQSLRTIHQLCMMDVFEKRMDVNSYLSPKWLAWLSDVEMKNRKEEKEWIQIKDEKSVYCTYYIPRMESEYAMDIYRMIKSNGACRLLVSCYEPVSDQAVVEKIKREFFSFEGILATLTRKNHGIGKILHSKENERRFLITGLYFILGAENKEHLFRCKETLQKDMQKYGCKIIAFPREQLVSYKNLLTFRPWLLGKTCLMQTQDAVKMNPFYRENEYVETVEETEKDAYLRLFDQMT